MYVGDAYPWAAAPGEAALGALKQVVQEEAAAVAGLGRYLVRRHVTPEPLPSYPSAFTTLNFVGIAFVLPRLVESQRQAVAALERDLPSLTDPDARAHVEQLLGAKRRHLAELEALAAREPQTAAR
jgi:hypothetical protein